MTCADSGIIIPRTVSKKGFFSSTIKIDNGNNVLGFKRILPS
jgi:hypothetical protein